MQAGAPERKGGGQGAKLVAMGEEPGAGRGVPAGGQGAGEEGRWAEVEGGTEMGGLDQEGQSRAFEGGVVPGP